MCRKSAVWMTFNAYEISAPLAFAASRTHLQDVVRDRSRTVQFPCEFDSRRADNTCSYGLCRTKYCIRATKRPANLSQSCIPKSYLHLAFPLRIQNKRKIVAGHRICCSCSKSVAVVYGRLAGSIFCCKMLLLFPYETLRNITIFPRRDSVGTRTGGCDSGF